jgi:hypothetical protein
MQPADHRRSSGTGSCEFVLSLQILRLCQRPVNYGFSVAAIQTVSGGAARLLWLMSDADGDFPIRRMFFFRRASSNWSISPIMAW